MSLSGFSFKIIACFFLSFSVSSAFAICNDQNTLTCHNGASYPVHLTFDDGPNPIYTPVILDTLKREKVSATFFVVGNNVTPGNKALLRRMEKEGHIIGTHSIDHTALAKTYSKGEITDEQVAAQVTEPVKRLSRLKVQPSEYFRFPYGDGWLAESDPERDAAREKVMTIARAQGAQHVGWDIDSWDWNKMLRNGNPARFLRQVCSNFGGVMLMHDIQSYTAEHLGEFIEALRCSGHRIVGLDEIIRHNSGLGNYRSFHRRASMSPGIPADPNAKKSKVTEEKKQPNKKKDEAPDKKKKTNFFKRLFGKGSN